MKKRRDGKKLGRGLRKVNLFSLILILKLKGIREKKSKKLSLLKWIIILSWKSLNLNGKAASRNLSQSDATNLFSVNLTTRF